MKTQRLHPIAMALTLLNCTGWMVHQQLNSLTLSLFFCNSLTCFACRLPVARPGELLGLVGTHSIGKSTALKVLAGELIPNLGRLNVNQVYFSLFGNMHAW